MYRQPNISFTFSYVDLNTHRSCPCNNKEINDARNFSKSFVQNEYVYGEKPQIKIQWCPETPKQYIFNPLKCISVSIYMFDHIPNHTTITKTNNHTF